MAGISAARGLVLLVLVFWVWTVDYRFFLIVAVVPAWPVGGFRLLPAPAYSRVLLD